jgi:hypothetical protein
MTTTNKFSSLLSAFLVLMLFGTGCLKDELYEDQISQTQINKDDKIIEVMGPIIGSRAQVLEFSTEDTTLNLATVRLAAIEPASEDIKVTLALDTAVIAEYNTRANESFTPLPATGFQVPTFEVTIPKGQREAVLPATILDPSFLESGSYALGVKVVSVSNPGYKISGNYGKQVISLVVKNQYDAQYDVDIDLTHPTASGNYPDESHFSTVNPTTVEAPLGIANLFAASSVVYITVNADNTLSITSNAVTINMLGPNFYDPASQTFHFDYGWSGTRRIQGTAVRK